MTSEWRTVTVEEISGKWKSSMAVGPFGSRMKADLYVPTGVRVIRGNNLGRGLSLAGSFVHVSAETANSLGSSCLMPGDLVFPHRGNIGEVGLTPDDGHRYMLSTSLMKLSPDRDLVDPLFLFYFFKSGAGRAALLMNASQVGTPGIATPLKSLRHIKLSIPNIRVQKNIANTLRNLDDRITLLTESNKTLEAIAQALFKSWFVDFDPVKAKIEGKVPEGMDAETAALFPDSFEMAELNGIPRGWSVTRVSEVAEIVKGKSYSSNDLVESNSTALVTLKSFERGGGFRMDGFKPFAGAYKPSQVVRAGDLIVAYTDVTQAAELIGKPAIVVGVEEYDTLVASLDVGIVRPDSEKCGRQYLYGLFKTDAFQHHSLAHTSGTTVLHLAKDAVGSFVFPLPPIQLIKQFEAIACEISRRKQNNIDQIRSLITVRDTLLPRLISGQLRITEAETKMEVITA